MKTSIRFKTTISPLLILFALGCFALPEWARGVTPAPDGGYPGGNTAEGNAALSHLTTGHGNTALGLFTLYFNTSGNENTAVGAGAMIGNGNGSANTAVGREALLNNTANYNTGEGYHSLYNNTTGTQNTANGVNAMMNNTEGDFNTADGTNALYHNTFGYHNTASGVQALFNNTVGVNNTAYGYQALLGQNNSVNNTAIGAYALRHSTAFGNTALGLAAGDNVTNAGNVICIGTEGANVNNSCFIGNIRGVTPAQGGAIPVYIDNQGQLGTTASSARFKKDIRSMDKASEALLSFRPVTFRYKTDSGDVPQFGLIAEEVAEVNPDLVVRDGDGEIYTVRYDAVNAMLLNEFLKEHKKVEAQSRKMEEHEATIAQLKKDFQMASAEQRKEIEFLTAQIKQQAAQIQRVSAQFEMIKSAPQTANNR